MGLGMLFRQLFDSETFTYTYLLADEETRQAILIDPVAEKLERDIALLKELGLTLKYTLETHVHADHVTASGELRQRLGSQSVVSDVAGAACADVPVKDGQVIEFGHERLRVMATPGHTDGCVTYVSDEHGLAFTGDALLIRGCGRTDFQQGDAHKLYASAQRLFGLPGDTKVYPGHDYKGFTHSTIEEEKRFNPRLAGKTEQEFVKLMSELQLARPKQIDRAVPANMACGDVKRSAWAPVEMANGVPEVTVGWTASHSADVRLVDVREPHEFSGELGHVERAELVPLNTLESMATGWDRSEPLVVLCRSGNRSGVAANKLKMLGFQHVASMRGGMLEWRQQNLSVAH